MIIPKKNINLVLTVFLATICFAIASQVAVGQENFYQGKTLTIVIRSTAGGGYDEYGRLVAQHIGKHIPGNPRVIVVNRPGAGGLVATNYMYNQAPQDGTEILIASRDLVLAQRIGIEGIRYDARNFNYLGSAASDTAVYLSGVNVPVTNLDELAEYNRNFGTFRLAASGLSGGTFYSMLILREGGYDVDLVTGYEGGNDQVLAVLRGEVPGMSASYSSVRDTILQEGLNVFAKLGNEPELRHVDDLRDRLEGDALFMAQVQMSSRIASRPFLTGPNVPQERVEILRAAFKATLEDPALLADAERSGLPIDYVDPSEMMELFEATLNVEDSIIDIFR